MSVLATWETHLKKPALTLSTHTAMAWKLGQEGVQGHAGPTRTCKAQLGRED